MATHANSTTASAASPALVRYFLDHDEAICDLKALASLFDMVARGMHREGIGSEEMPVLAFLADLMAQRAQVALDEWHGAFELAKGVSQ